MAARLRPAPRHLAALLVLGVTLAVFAHTLGFQFVAWDDGITIYQNPNLGPLSLERVAWAFTDVATTMRWIPLTLLSLSLTHTLHGLDPFGYHLANWLIHGATALLLFLVLLELLGPAARRRGEAPDGPWTLASAAVGALAWALHPLRVEVVAWSNSRGHAQASLFAVLSLLVYLRTHRPDAPSARPLAGSALAAGCYLLALTSHPVVLGLAPVFLLLDVHLGRLGGAAGWWGAGPRRVLVEKLPFVAAAALVLLVTVLVRNFASGRWPAPVPLSEWGLFARAMQATWIWLHYVLVTFWPADLQPAPTALIDFDPWSAPFLGRAAAVVAVTAGLALAGRRLRLALLAWLAHLALLVPSLGLFEHPMFACDRYANLPNLVLAALLAAGVLRLGATPARRRATAAAAAALLLLLGGLAHRQARAWTDSLALYAHMIPRLGDHPYRVNVWLFEGWAHADRGDAAAAVASIQNALDHYQPHLSVITAPAELHLHLARSQWQAGRRAEAVGNFRIAVSMRPSDAERRCELATALLLTARPEEARAQAQLALAMRPGLECALGLLERFEPGR